MAGAAKVTGAAMLMLKKDEVELFRTDADLLISIDPIFVGFFATLELLLTLTCLSFPQLSSHDVHEPAELRICTNTNLET